MKTNILKPKSSEKILKEIENTPPSIALFQCIKNNFHEGIKYIYSKSPDVLQKYSSLILQNNLPNSITVDTLKLLLNLGYQFKDGDRETLLSYYSLMGNYEMVKYLLSIGANPNYFEEGPRRTPLSYAAEHGYLNIVKLLVSSGAKIRYKNSIVFQWACLGNQLNVVRYFVEEENFDIKDFYKEDIAHILRDMGNYSVTGYLDEKINELNSIDI